MHPYIIFFAVFGFWKLTPLKQKVKLILLKQRVIDLYEGGVCFLCWVEGIIEKTLFFLEVGGVGC